LPSKVSLRRTTKELKYGSSILSTFAIKIKTIRLDMYKLFLEEGKKAFVRWVFVLCALSLTFLFTPLWDNTRAVWSSPKILAEIQTDIRDLKKDVSNIRGEDRVIRMDSSLSYVEEPYRLGSGDPIRAHYVIGRTMLGATCRLVSLTPIYTDDTGISTAGSTKGAVRQLSSNTERVVLELEPPRNLKAGRTVLTLELVFDCGGVVSVIDRTDPLVFMVVDR
jgi:hypothetical protein